MVKVGDRRFLLRKGKDVIKGRGTFRNGEVISAKQNILF